MENQCGNKIRSNNLRDQELKQQLFYLKCVLHNLRYKLQQEHKLLRDARDELQRMKSDCPNNLKPKTKLQEAIANEVKVTEVYAGNAAFANSVYKILAKQPGNIFFSPLGIRAVLALTYMGAEGHTALEMADGLQLPRDPSAVKTAFHDILLSYITKCNNGNTTITLASKIFVDEKKEVIESFIDTARESFFSSLQNVDFSSPEEARQTVNTWVDERTNSNIKQVLGEDDISTETTMLLVNAVYFSGEWETKFPPSKESVISFTVRPGETVNLPLLHNTDVYKIATSDDLKADILELPYENSDVSLMIVLPNKVDGLSQLESVLCDAELKATYQKLKMETVEVQIPKFKLTVDTRLKGLLQQLGMNLMFDEDLVDFSGIAKRSDRVHISEVIHKSFLDVDEAGTTAAAATSVDAVPVMSGDISTPEVRNFTADHPFMFLLISKNTNTALFMGRFTQPEV